MIDPPAPPIGFAALPEPLRARVEAELAPGERLLWAAQPDLNGPRGRRREMVTLGVWVLASVGLGLMCLVALYFLPPQYRESSGVCLFMAVLAFGGLASIFLTYIFSVVAEEVSWIGQDRLYLYALTDRRALVWSPGERTGAVAIRQFLAGTVHPERIERTESPDGSGDLTFKPTDGAPGRDGFYAVTDVRRVDDLVRRFLVGPTSWPKPAPIPHLDDYEEPF